MYKDKDKQREADKERQRRRRDKIKAEGVTNSGRDKQGVTGGIILTLAANIDDNAKRGKDIKSFEDLPPDVQATINRVSESNEEKAKRTAAAIKYQHLFPDRYNSTGV